MPETIQIETAGVYVDYAGIETIKVETAGSYVEYAGNEQVQLECVGIYIEYYSSPPTGRTSGPAALSA
jgi:hypothetical protein